MEAKKLPNGKLLVPRRAEGPGGIVGDGMDEIGPDDPGYADWLAWIEGDKPDLSTWSPDLLVAALRNAEDAAFKNAKAALELQEEVNRRGDLIRRLAGKRRRSFQNSFRVALADEMAADARRFREQGLSIRQTALRMDTSPRQVSRWLARPARKY